MPTLALTNFNIVCATLGGFITVFGLVSYLFKEHFYLSEALISLVAGLIFSPHATNFLRPDEYALHNVEILDTITLYFTRLVLGIQLVLAGVQLPSKYLKTEWKSLALLLGPGMTVMWLVTSLLVFAFVPNISFLHALAVGACVTPTDPVLSNSIVKGKFADKNIPKELQKIIVAESGANDGLGYPFLFLPLYLIQHIGHGGMAQDNSVKNAIGLWFGETWAYTILLSVIYGATVGWIAKELLHWAEEKKYVDRESFLVFAITLALFIVGTCGMLGSDDVLACFIAGNVFTWDDWFRLETMDDSFQPTIDMLLNVSIFIWFGAVCPWVDFYHNNVIPIYRLVLLGIFVLLLRRPPIIFAMHKQIHQIEQKRQALFVDGEVREDAKYLMEVMNVVIWFLAICSIVVHGLSIPMAKLGFLIPRTLSNVLSSARDEDEPQPFHVQENAANAVTDIERRLRRRPGWSRTGGDSLPQRVVRSIGRSMIRTSETSASHSRATSERTIPLSAVGAIARDTVDVNSVSNTGDGAQIIIQSTQRAIRFPDSQRATTQE
ncbi:Nn.00g078270.m01.CDS01 [Neocucurbitaria sp. VM-36]